MSVYAGARGRVVVRKRRTSGSSTTIAPNRVNSVSGWTKTDPNTLLQSVTDGNPEGLAVQLQNPAAARFLPSTGLCWSKPLTTLTDSVGGTLANPLDPEDTMWRIQLYERIVPATAPNLMIFGFGYMDNAVPTSATSAIYAAIGYPSGSLRRVTAGRCVSGTWSIDQTATGQVNCFGGQYDAVPKSTGGEWDVNGVPLDIFGNIGTIGSNTVNITGTATDTGWTHQFVYVGWDGAGGTPGDTIQFAAAGWLFPMTGRG